MNENCLAYGIEISGSDWEETPASVKQLVEKMRQHIKELEQRLADLEAQQQELLEKSIAHPKTHHHHRQVTHSMPRRNKKRKRAV
jgi:phage shock protein A